METIKIDKKGLHEYARQAGIRFIVLFGSHADKTFNKESDFDIAVYLINDKPIFENFKEYYAMLEKLGNLLMIEQENIDLIDLRSANILLRYEITSKGKLLYGDKEQYEELKAFAYRDYIDASPLFRLEDLIIKKRQALIKETFITP